MCSNINCTQSTPCNSCLTNNYHIPCSTCDPCTTVDPCATPTEPCCKVKIESFKCVTNAEITSSALGIQPDDTLDEVIEKIIAHFSTLTGFYKGDTGEKGEPGPRGKRGCRGPAGTGGDTIESVVNNGDGTVTITTVLGDVFTFEVSPPEPIVVQNTLFVSKLGNDSIGLRTRFDKHFLTIAAASAVAQVGDIVFVYPGTYTEADNPFASNVTFHLYKGVEVVCVTNVFADTESQAKNYIIRGEGVITANGSLGRCVFLTNPASNIDAEVDTMQGNYDGITILDADFRIKGKLLKTNTQYIATVRGTSSGVLDFEEYDASVTSFATNNIFIINLRSLEGITIKGGIYKASTAIGAAINITNCGESPINIDLDIEGINSSGVYGIYQDSAKLSYSGFIKGFEVAVNVIDDQPTVVTYLKDAKIETIGIALLLTSNGNNIKCILDEVELKRVLDTGGEVLLTNTNSGILDLLLSNTVIINENTVATSVGMLINGISNIQLSNCKIYTKTGLESMQASFAVNVGFLTDLLSSNTRGVNVTNIVTGTTEITTTLQPISL